MGREWKPGDVAMVNALNRPTPYRAHFDGKVWVEYDRPGSQLASPTTARPLVVIDPEDREQVERLAIGYERDDLPGETAISDMQAALRSLVSPPKPDEPQGLGAVVEDRDGNKWIRRGSTHYIAAEGSSSGFYNNAQTWGEINAVRVLSEGVQP